MTNGWIVVHIEGEPYERGVSYGKQIVDELKRIWKTLEFICMEDLGHPWSYYIQIGKKHLRPIIEKKYHEFFEEMRGVATGSTQAGFPLTVDDILAWNNYFALTESWSDSSTTSTAGTSHEGGSSTEEESSNEEEEPSSEHLGGEGEDSIDTSIINDFTADTAVISSAVAATTTTQNKRRGQQERCSAFIATGKTWTSDGKIVVAHNNFSNFVDGQFGRTLVHMHPSKGATMMWIGFAGWIWSGTDFFITSAGIVGTETTIGGFHAYDPSKSPISCRIRQAMQYGTTLDDYVNILVSNNAGDYANSWLFGDTNTNEIMRLELGLKYIHVDRTTDGYYIGFNAAYDPQIRNLECSNSGFNDIRRHQGARRVRLDQLMHQYKGRLSVATAKLILADHFDVYSNKTFPCSRTVCAHYDEDPREYMSDPSRPLPFQPRGALDGNIASTSTIKQMSFWMKWGRSCNTPFHVAKFIKKHPQWGQYAPFLLDRPNQPWTLFNQSTIDPPIRRPSSSSGSRRKKPSLSKKTRSTRTNKHTHSS